MKLTEEQKQKILAAKEQINFLQNQGDVIYDDLVKELNFEPYQLAYDDLSFWPDADHQPASFLFDMIYNKDQISKSDFSRLQQILDDLS